MYSGFNSSLYNIHCILLAYENLCSNFTSWQSLTLQSLSILMSPFYIQTLFLIANLQVLDKFVAPILFFPHRFYVKIAVSKNDINCCWNKYRCQQRNPSLWLDLKLSILRCLCKIFSIDNIQISYLILILRCTIISFQWHC